MIRSLSFVCSALVLVLGLRAEAKVLWRGDFSTGDLSQWPGRETVDVNTRLKVVPDPIDASRPVLRTLVKSGDDPINASGNRNELTYTTDRPAEGAERYYHWRTLWPNDYRSADTWQIFTQWHQYVTGGSPPMAFQTWGEKILFGMTQYGDQWTTPLVRGRWHDFVFHVKWSSDARVGFIELWYDGEKAIEKKTLATMYPRDTVYLKQGLYRKDIITYDQVVYTQGTTVATELADVMPPPPPPPPVDPPDAGTVDPGTADAGTPDAGTIEQGLPDAGTVDPGTSGSGSDGTGLTGTEHVKASCSQAGPAGFAPLLVAALGLVAARRRRTAQALQ